MKKARINSYGYKRLNELNDRVKIMDLEITDEEDLLQFYQQLCVIKNLSDVISDEEFEWIKNVHDKTCL